MNCKQVAPFFAGTALLCTAVSVAQEITPHASRVIVRVATPSEKIDSKKTIRVRWVSVRKPPAKVVLWANEGYRTGDAVGVSDTGFSNEVTLNSPGAHDFTFDSLDRNHPKIVGVSAEGFYTAEVMVDSGGLEVEVVLQQKFEDSFRE